MGPEPGSTKSEILPFNQVNSIPHFSFSLDLLALIALFCLYTHSVLRHEAVFSLLQFFSPPSPFSTPFGGDLPFELIDYVSDA